MSSTLDSAGWPREDDDWQGHGQDRERGSRDGRHPGTSGPGPGPGFLTAPFASRTWRESLQAVLNLPVGIASCTYVATMLTVGLCTVMTFVGLPVLAVAVGSGRGLGRMERARAASLLDLDTPAPVSPIPRRPGVMAWIGATLRDGAGWRGALYGLLMLPFGIVSFLSAVVLWSTALECASYPLWQWVFPEFVHQPGIQLYENNDHTHYLSSVPLIAVVCAFGLVLLFVTPWVVRGLANVQRAMVRGLLAG